MMLWAPVLLKGVAFQDPEGQMSCVVGWTWRASWEEGIGDQELNYTGESDPAHTQNLDIHMLTNLLINRVIQ